MGAWDLKPLPDGGESRWYRRGTGAGTGGRGKWLPANHGVRAIQMTLTRAGHAVDVIDGHYAPQTEARCKTWQAANGLVADGVFGMKSARVAFGALVSGFEADFAIPDRLLCGMVDLESAWDPGAVGANGYDSGLAQINLDPVGGHGGAITAEQAYDPLWALRYTARRMVDAAGGFRARLAPLAWRLAAGQHNSPLAAKLWLDAALRQPPRLDDDSEASARVLRNVSYVRLTAERCA